MSKLPQCPKCHSQSIAANKKGFSVGKAAIGGLAVGGVGLAAGLVGRNKIVLTCLNCGHEFSPLESKAAPKVSDSLLKGSLVFLAVAILLFILTLAL